MKMNNQNENIVTHFFAWLAAVASMLGDHYTGYGLYPLWFYRRGDFPRVVCAWENGCTERA